MTDTPDVFRQFVSVESTDGHGPYTHTIHPVTVHDLPWWSWTRLSPLQRRRRNRARRTLERGGWLTPADPLDTLTD